MPFKSEKQRRFLHANHPEIAARWEGAQKVSHVKHKYDPGVLGCKTCGGGKDSYLHETERGPDRRKGSRRSEGVSVHWLLDRRSTSKRRSPGTGGLPIHGDRRSGTERRSS